MQNKIIKVIRIGLIPDESVLHTGLDLCLLKYIDIDQFDNFKSFKTYFKYLDSSKIMIL